MSYLKLKEVAELFGVSEKTVYRLRRKGTLPAVKIGGQWRFDRREIDSYLQARNRRQSCPLPSSGGGLSLSEALLAGGIFYHIPGRSLQEVLKNAIEHIYLSPKNEQEKLIKAIIFREGLCTTAVGGGIALPHPRHPASFNFAHSTVSLCFLEEELELEAMDGRPVDKLFFVFGRSEQEHLQLLKLLANTLHQAVFRRLLERAAGRLEILRCLQELEGRACPGGSCPAPGGSETSVEGKRVGNES